MKSQQPPHSKDLTKDCISPIPELAKSKELLEANGINSFSSQGAGNTDFDPMSHVGGRPLIASCRSGTGLAGQVVETLYRNHGDELHHYFFQNDLDYSFSDSETCVRLAEEVNGSPVFLFQSLFDPTSSRSVDQNYMAFLIAVRALKEWGARMVTGIVPYLAYARQNRPTRGQREPVTARLMADLSDAAGLDGLITFKPHTDGIASFYRDVVFEQPNPVDFFATVFANFYDQTDTILVSPDAGAVPFVTEVGRALRLKCAVGSKYRPRAEECSLAEIIGDFNGIKTAIVLDDMVSSGGTVYNLIRRLRAEKGVEQIYLAAAHNLCLEIAKKRLIELHNDFGLSKVVFTNSIPQTADFLALSFVEIIDLSTIIAGLIEKSLMHPSAIYDLV